MMKVKLKMWVASLGLAAAALSAPLATASGGHGPVLREAHIDVHDKLSLQRGARLFSNYCLSCHSANFMRYERVAKDLKIEPEIVLDNLVNTADTKIGETMTINMRPADGAAWFGKTPPDLSVIARARGKDWLYSYLTGFYVDAKRPVGVNNIYFKDVGMPHVLWELQGWQKAVFDEVEDSHGNKHPVFSHFESISKGQLTEREYDRAARDLVNFLVYMGEPSQLQRAEIRPYVIGFLIVFTFLAYLLKKEYWRDVH